MINLFNLNLEGISEEDQCKKIAEEMIEYYSALDEYTDRGSNTSETEEKRLREHLIEEFWDVIQANLGLMEIHGISAYEVQQGYEKHHKKMASRDYKPRTKPAKV